MPPSPMSPRVAAVLARRCSTHHLKDARTQPEQPCVLAAEMPPVAANTRTRQMNASQFRCLQKLFSKKSTEFQKIGTKRAPFGPIYRCTLLSIHILPRSHRAIACPSFPPRPVLRERVGVRVLRILRPHAIALPHLTCLRKLSEGKKTHRRIPDTFGHTVVHSISWRSWRLGG
jgi:hypothetical protein